GSVTNDLVGTVRSDPRLGDLQDNGGRTRTMALLPDSPAINAGAASGAPTTDQRGVLRNIYNGGTVDIRAYEARLVANMVVNTASDAITDDNSTLSLREAIDLANDTLRFADLSPEEQAQVTPVAGSVSTIRFANNLKGETITLSTAGSGRVGPS